METFSLEKDVTFIHGDISDEIEKFQKKEFSLVLAQRVLHYIPYDNAVVCVQNIERIMTIGASLWFSISPLDSDMADGYGCAVVPIEKRFCAIEKSLQKRFNLYAPVCLYSRSEVEQLLNNTNLEKQDLYTTSFGNIKGHFFKK